jgi:hypothetical protein
VPADLQSAGIEYKDFSIRLLPISYCIGMSLGSKILIFFAVEFFAALNNTCISARTLVLLLLYKEFPTTKNISLIAFMLRDKK